MLFLFFFLIPHYAPQSSGQPMQMDSVLGWFFGLVWFVAYQTLGIVHEAGHGLCYLLPCPQTFSILNGTLFQWLFPLGISFYAWRRKERFGAAVAFYFFGLSLLFTALYVATAHQGLHLPASRSFLGVDAIHDFNYLLGHWGLLAYEGFIAGTLKFLSTLTMLAALAVMTFSSL